MPDARDGLAAVVAVQILLLPAWLSGAAPWLSLDGLLVLFVAMVAPRGVAWALLAVAMVWEVTRAGGAALMHQDPLLYDLSFLLGHLRVLARDLFGALALPLVLVLLLAVGALFGVVAALLPRARRVSRPAVGLTLSFTFLAWALGLPVRFGLGALPGNVWASIAVGSAVEGQLAAAAATPLPELRLDGRPDLEVVVVESYGRILFDRKRPRERWQRDVMPLERVAERAGLTVVSGFVRSTVSGGRSWLADASLLTDIPVAHEAVFQQAMARADQLPHLPRVLHAQGYQTVVVRPKDRERPGVKIRNDLRFDRTVYFTDLGYHGPPVGWGWVPDQYTLGWLRDEVLVAEGPPRFVFTHLVSSHAPWSEVPERATDWKALNTGEAPDLAEVEERPAWDELMVQLGRFQRRDAHRGKRKGSGDHVERYSDAISYDLDLLATHLKGPAGRPRVLVILGDHQPPLVTQTGSFDVPVHVVSTDPAYLSAWQARGFQVGWLPSGEATVGIEELGGLLLGNP